MEKTMLEGVSAPVIEYIGSLENKLEHALARIDQLTELLLSANKAKYGPSSEKIEYLLSDEYAQGSLFNEAEVCADDSEPEKIIIERHERKKKRTKEELAEGLPTKEIIVDLPEDGRKCGICEGDLQTIGKELVRSELRIIPAQAYVAKIYRINYSCKDCMDETDEANIIKL